MKALVTIIVGIYNGEKYLAECIESIIRQSYSTLEIILVNDGSSDSSGEVVEAYAKKDKRIITIHQKNSGVSISRNNALAVTTGDYICVVDQDDVLAIDYVEYFYHLLVDNKADIAFTPQPHKFWGCVPIQKKTKDQIYVIEGKKAAEEMLYHKMVISPWNKMISHKIIKENNLKFNPRFFNGEGFAFSIECFQRAERVVRGQRKIYYYRVGDPESGASKFKISTIESSINAQQYIKDTFVEETPELMKAWEFSNWHTHCDCLNIMVGCKKTKDYIAEYNILKAVCKNKALCAIPAPISIQQRFRGIMYKINPFIAAKIINFLRMRKFSEGN